MQVVLLVAALVILGGVVLAALGRVGEMATFASDTPPMDLDDVSATDVALLRPPMSLWGYNAQATEDALRVIARSVTARDVEIATLRQELADLRGNTDRAGATKTGGVPVTRAGDATVAGGGGAGATAASDIPVTRASDAQVTRDGGAGATAASDIPVTRNGDPQATRASDRPPGPASPAAPPGAPGQPRPAGAPAGEAGDTPAPGAAAAPAAAAQPPGPGAETQPAGQPPHAEPAGPVDAAGQADAARPADAARQTDAAGRAEPATEDDWLPIWQRSPEPGPDG